MEEEKFGTIITDGRIVNLDSLSSEELGELEEQLSAKEEELRKKIDEIIGE